MSDEPGERDAQASQTGPTHVCRSDRDFWCRVFTESEFGQELLVLRQEDGPLSAVHLRVAPARPEARRLQRGGPARGTGLRGRR